MIYFCDQSWIFSFITPVFSVTWSFRNHSNMLICCSSCINYYWYSIINSGSYYYQCWKHILLLNIFVETMIYYFVQDLIIWWIEQHLFEILIFCNIINAFTVPFNELIHASMLNKSIIIILMKSYLPQTLESYCITVSSNILSSKNCFQH